MRPVMRPFHYAWILGRSKAGGRLLCPAGLLTFYSWSVHGTTVNVCGSRDPGDWAVEPWGTLSGCRSGRGCGVIKLACA